MAIREIENLNRTRNRVTDFSIVAHEGICVLCMLKVQWPSFFGRERSKDTYSAAEKYNSP